MKKMFLILFLFVNRLSTMEKEVENSYTIFQNYIWQLIDSKLNAKQKTCDVNRENIINAFTNLNDIESSLKLERNTFQLLNMEYNNLQLRQYSIETIKSAELYYAMSLCGNVTTLPINILFLLSLFKIDQANAFLRLLDCNYDNNLKAFLVMLPITTIFIIMALHFRGITQSQTSVDLHIIDKIQQSSTYNN